MIPSIYHKKPNVVGPRICLKCSGLYTKHYGMNNSKCSACISKEKYVKNKTKLQAYHREWGRQERLNNHDRVLARERKRRLRKPDEALKYKYGITQTDYNEMLAKQNGVCAICGGTEVLAKTCKRLYVDHDHKTNVVRGLLCGHCNTALGHMKDDPQRLEKAAAYLRKNSG